MVDRDLVLTKLNRLQAYVDGLKEEEPQTEEAGAVTDTRWLRPYFWEYDLERFDKIPARIVAQRFVDMWDMVHEDVVKGRIGRQELLFILKQIARAYDEVRWPESVRKRVIDLLMEKYGVKGKG